MLPVSPAGCVLVASGTGFVCVHALQLVFNRFDFADEFTALILHDSNGRSIKFTRTVHYKNLIKGFRSA